MRLHSQLTISLCIVLAVAACHTEVIRRERLREVDSIAYPKKESLPSAVVPGPRADSRNELTVTLTTGRQETHWGARPAMLDDSVIVDKGPGTTVLAIYELSQIVEIRLRSMRTILETYEVKESSISPTPLIVVGLVLAVVGLTYFVAETIPLP